MFVMDEVPNLDPGTLKSLPKFALPEVSLLSSPCHPTLLPNQLETLKSRFSAQVSCLAQFIVTPAH